MTKTKEIPITDKLLRDLQRKGVNIYPGSQVSRPRLYKTGWPSIDAAIGGIAAGRITYIWGPRGAGKSTLCYNIANSFLQDGWVLYIDAERSFDQAWASKFVDLEQVYVMSPSSKGAEAQVDAIKGLLQSDNPPALVVIDSLSAMTSSRSMERDLEKALMGVDAMFNNRMINILNIVNEKAAIVFVGQHREGIGTWDYLPGGNGIAHMSSLIIKMKSSPLRAKDSDLSGEDDKQQIGILSRWFVQKNKLGPPYSQGYEALYREGFIDKFDSELRIALAKGIVAQAGSWYSMPSGDRVQGQAKARSWAEDHKDEWERLIYGTVEKS